MSNTETQVLEQTLIVYREADKIEGLCGAFYLASLLETPTHRVVVKNIEREYSLFTAAQDDTTTIIFLGTSFEERHLADLLLIKNPKMLFTLDETLNNSEGCQQILLNKGVENLSLPTLVHFLIQQHIDGTINTQLAEGEQPVKLVLPEICKMVNSRYAYSYQSKEQRALARMVMLSISYEVPTLRNWRLIFKMNLNGLVRSYKDFGEKMIRYSNYKNSTLGYRSY